MRRAISRNNAKQWPAGGPPPPTGYTSPGFDSATSSTTCSFGTARTDGSFSEVSFNATSLRRAYCNDGKNTGKFYAEFQVIQDDVVTPQIGLDIAGRSLTTSVGSTGIAVYYDEVSTDVHLLVAGVDTVLDTGTIVGYFAVAVDFDAGKIWFGRVFFNGVNLSIIWYGAGDPATGANPTATFAPGATLRFISLSYTATVAVGAGIVDSNETNAATPPAGFGAWG